MNTFNLLLEISLEHRQEVCYYVSLCNSLSKFNDVILAFRYSEFIEILEDSYESMQERNLNWLVFSEMI